MAYHTKQLPPVEILNEYFSPDFDNGVLYWAVRPEGHFVSPSKANAWNTKYSGKPVGATLTEKGYLKTDLCICGERKRLRIHRVLYYMATGEQPEQVDHINGICDDNMLSNLRPATNSQNKFNSRRSKSSSDLPKGVSKYNKSKYAGYCGNVVGVSDNMFEAHMMYLDVARKEHGEFFFGDDVSYSNNELEKGKLLLIKRKELELELKCVNYELNSIPRSNNPHNTHPTTK